MSLIRFNESSSPIEVKLSSDSFGHIILVFENKDDIPDKSILTSGFIELNEHNYIEQSNFLNMNYVFREVNDSTYILTKEPDDVYIEPEIPSESQDFTEEYIPTIDDIKYMKISSLSSICNKQIINGVDIKINDNIEHFSYTEEDQSNIKELFDLAVQTNVPMYYHSDGNSCKLYTVEQIIELYVSSAMNKMHHITYFNQLKMYLNTLNNADAINSVEYGVELTGEYLNTYNAAMKQARVGMETLLKG